jgi:hypothetical protein
MNPLKTTLGSVALLVASNAAGKSDDLLAGPLPVDPGFLGTGTITCSATNVSAALVNIAFTIRDANDVPIAGSNCSNLSITKSCSTTVTFGPNIPPVPSSPFICLIFANPTTGTGSAPVRGSICAEISNPQARAADGTYCLQALFNNGQSGGWTPSGGP